MRWHIGIDHQTNNTPGARTVDGGPRSGRQVYLKTWNIEKKNAERPNDLNSNSTGV